MTITCASVGLPRLHNDDDNGIVQFGSELTELDYFLINRVPPDCDLGQHHYVEIWDQSGGGYDAVARIELASDGHSLDLWLNRDLFSDDRHVRIEMPGPLDDESILWLAEFSKSLRVSTPQDESHGNV